MSEADNFLIGEAAILPAGKRQLDGGVTGLKRAPTVRELKITGFAERHLERRIGRARFGEGR